MSSSAGGRCDKIQVCCCHHCKSQRAALQNFPTPTLAVERKEQEQKESFAAQFQIVPNSITCPEEAQMILRDWLCDAFYLIKVFLTHWQNVIIAGKDFYLLLDVVFTTDFHDLK